MKPCAPVSFATPRRVVEKCFVVTSDPAVVSNWSRWRGQAVGSASAEPLGVGGGKLSQVNAQPSVSKKTRYDRNLVNFNRPVRAGLTPDNPRHVGAVARDAATGG